MIVVAVFILAGFVVSVLLTAIVVSLVGELFADLDRRRGIPTWRQVCGDLVLVARRLRHGVVSVFGFRWPR